ncbi:MAG: HPP family protein [Opitutae bacterium]|nr:HPP family protein [Opitutae bacterium]
MKNYLAKLSGQGAALPPRFALRRIALAGLGAASAIGLVSLLAAKTHQPLLLGSLGASCVFLFGLPEAPFSQPRNVIAGHLLCSLIGLVCLKLFGPAPWALGLALGLSVVAMFATRTVHAPAGSNPVIVFLARPDWGFLLAPTLLGAVGVVAVALLFNNAVHPGRYPLYWLGRDDA